ncbi:hypothetical protein VZT92_016584 [Zoarces viviparus]|uniref:Uncharacterized protein n=1 Tax=Zoarces viviparus TaxID=48416 RepID=A0AAW1ETK0_ZOAVI
MQSVCPEHGRGTRRVPPPAPSLRRALAPSPEESLTLSASLYVTAGPVVEHTSGFSPPGGCSSICFRPGDQFRPKSHRLDSCGPTRGN